MNENTKQTARLIKKSSLGDLIVFGIILGIFLLIATIMALLTYYFVRTTEGHTLTVNGTAKQQVTSDLAKWNGVFQRTVLEEDLKAGYEQMRQNKELVLKFFKDNGFDEKQVIISPIIMESKFDPNAPREYILRQNVFFQTNDVHKVTDMAQNVQVLINQGVIFSTYFLDYYYSNETELRNTMLKDAVADAKKRAQDIAEITGLEVSVIKSASTGVVQLLPVTSVIVSNFGPYATGTIEKEVLVTVTATFELR